MFLFVLLGLVTLFESTQVHVSRSFAGYATIALCAATVGMGADLVSIYQTAIRTQNSLEPAMVYKAVWFSLALMLSELTGMELHDEYDLLNQLKELSSMQKAYGKVRKNG